MVLVAGLKGTNNSVRLSRYRVSEFRRQSRRRGAPFFETANSAAVVSPGICAQPSRIS